jgi:hypothetical protein
MALPAATPHPRLKASSVDEAASSSSVGCVGCHTTHEAGEKGKFELNSTATPAASAKNIRQLAHRGSKPAPLLARARCNLRLTDDKPATSPAPDVHDDPPRSRAPPRLDSALFD